MRLHAAPPYLNIQLKRFVFDMKTYTRKKVTEKFSFPCGPFFPPKSHV